MKLPNKHPRKAVRSKGAALIVVLAMLVLILGILGAFLSRSGTNRDTSGSSASLTAVDLLSSGAINQVVGNLQQEIRDTSDDDGDPAKSVGYNPPNKGDKLYLPKEPRFAVPEIELPGLTVIDLLPDPDTGVGSGLENLLKVSMNKSDPSDPNSDALTPTDVPSRNGRSISLERWNKPLLMKRTASDGSDDSPPVKFPTPDWILVSRDGENITDINKAKWNADPEVRDTVIGRYAYVVYNQGGLLDANVAGYPASADAPITGTSITKPSRYKTSAAYADLTIPEIGLTPTQINTLIKEWRNEATFAASDPAAEYFKLNLQNESGFLSTSNKSAPGGVTDRMFIGRRQLITFFEDKLGLKDGPGLDALQYFTTFSRSLNRPSFYRMQGAQEKDGSGQDLPNYHKDAPKVNAWDTDWASTVWNDMDNLGNSAFGQDAIINPIIPSITTSAEGTRIDGSSFAAREPLLRKRFPLDRLAWITYKGPSADLATNDPLITALESEGISRDYLAEGTAENIEKAFGLGWTAGAGPNGLGGYWTYDIHGTTTGINPINILEDVAKQSREPDFFEILKATINVGAIGRARHGFNGGDLATNLAMQDQIRRDSFINNHIIQLGANIIDQSQPDNFPTQIVIKDEPLGRNRSFWGTVDLPYFYGYTFNSVLVETPTPPNTKDSPFPEVPPRPELGADTDGDGLPDTLRPGDIVAASGAAAVILTPILWNPHGESTATLPADLTPVDFRICVTSSNYVDLSTGSLPVSDVKINYGTSHDEEIRLFPHPQMEDFYEADWSSSAQFSEADWSSSAQFCLNANEGIIDFSGTNPTALRFDYADPALFRQPTPLLRSNIPSGLNLRVSDTHQLNNVDLGQLGKRDFGDGLLEVGTSDRIFGFYVGRIPVRFNGDKLNNSKPYSTQTTSSVRLVMPATLTLTYSLEYSTDSGITWVPYQQVTLPASDIVDFYNYDIPWKFDAAAASTDKLKTGLANRWQLLNTNAPNNFKGYGSNRGRFFMDPRTERWGASGGEVIPGFAPDPSSGVTASLRPGAGLGLYANVAGDDLKENLEAGASSKTGLLWNHEAWHGKPWRSGPTNINAFRMPEYEPFLDADNVLRRPAGAWVPETTTQEATTTVGLPMATGGTLTTGNDRFNRPVILHRPFRSVAELSHVFTGSPWRQIDFFTPESGFTGLLDVFTINEDQRLDSLVAGKVDLNTRQIPVLKAILQGAYRDAVAGRSMPDVTTTDAGELARRLVARTGSNDPGKGPLWNLAHLVGRFDPQADTSATSPSVTPVRFDGFSSDLGVAVGTAPENLVQSLREAPIRALAQTGQAGTWNLMVDLIVQSGKFPPTASDLNDFVVEAEKRAWLHLSIDRLTGKLLDYEIEVVTE